MTNDSSSARWRHMNMNCDTARDWNIAPSFLHTKKSPCSLCEDFFTSELYKFICSEIVRYAHSNGKYNFELSVDELKAFIAILLLSAYVVLPCRPMYWECSDDIYNSIGSSLMPETVLNCLCKISIWLIMQTWFKMTNLQKLESLLNA